MHVGGYFFMSHVEIETEWNLKTRRLERVGKKIW